MTLAINFTITIAPSVPYQDTAPAPTPRKPAPPVAKPLWNQLLLAFMEDDDERQD